MTRSDVTPPRKRLSRTAALWLSIAAAVLVVALIIVAVTLGSAGRPGAIGATSSPSSRGQTPTPGASTTEPDVQPSGPATPGAPVPAPTAPAVPIQDPATAAPGVTVTVGSMEAVAGEAVRAGEVSGPAVRFTLTVTNATAEPVSLATALVNLYYGPDAVPAGELSKPGASALPLQVAAGASAAGVFVFTVPEVERDHVLITLDYQVDTPVLAFEGAVP